MAQSQAQPRASGEHWSACGRSLMARALARAPGQRCRPSLCLAARACVLSAAAGTPLRVTVSKSSRSALEPSRATRTLCAGAVLGRRRMWTGVASTFCLAPLATADVP